MTDIFFSYSHKDRDRVQPIQTALADRGFDVFWDLAVPAGVDWDRWIKARLDQSRCVIVFWTANSAASPNVRHEVAIGREEGKLLQVLLDPLSTRDLPMGILADQAVVLTTWQDDQSDPQWTKLLQAIEEMAMPRWVSRRVNQMRVDVSAAQRRVTEADGKVRVLEDAHSAEVAAQGELRRERDRVVTERDKLSKSLVTKAAKLSALSNALIDETADKDLLQIKYDDLVEKHRELETKTRNQQAEQLKEQQRTITDWQLQQKGKGIELSNAKMKIASIEYELTQTRKAEQQLKEIVAVLENDRSSRNARMQDLVAGNKLRNERLQDVLASQAAAAQQSDVAPSAPMPIRKPPVIDPIAELYLGLSSLIILANCLMKLGTIILPTASASIGVDRLIWISACLSILFFLSAIVAESKYKFIVVFGWVMFCVIPATIIWVLAYFGPYSGWLNSLHLLTLLALLWLAFGSFVQLSNPALVTRE